MDSLIEAALWYARRGWHVLPLQDKGKQPRIPEWTTQATVDENAIRAWWMKWPDANVGILTGEKSGLVVLDIDPRHGGDETLAELEKQHGKLPDTVEAITGGGGRHILFKHPGHRVTSKPNWAKGIDIRADGAQIVAAPSIHPSGTHYEWDVLCHPDDTKLAECPSWLLGDSKKPEHHVDGWADQLLAGVSDGQRDDACIKLAGRYVRLGLSDKEIEHFLIDWNKRNKPPMGDAIGDPRDVAEWVRKKINSARQAEGRKQSSVLAWEKTASLGASLDSILPDILAGKKPEMVHFGLPKLDDFLGGMRKGRVVTLAARTSMGKSAAAMRMALAAADLGKSILYISLEMPAEELAMRALSAVSGVKVGLLDTGNLKANHFTALIEKRHTLNHMRDKLTFHFQAGMTPDKLAEVVEKQKASGLDLVVVDHIGLMATRANASEYEAMTKVAQGLKTLALSADLPILALVQLNRLAEDNTNSRPTLRNLRGSGHIEEMSDCVLLLYRAKYYDENAADELEIHVAKARQGETGRIRMPYAEVLKFTPTGGELSGSRTA